MHSRRSRFAHALRAALVSIVLAPVLALADHGPGTSGGGSSVPSGETMPGGKFALSLRTDFTSYESVSDQEIRTRTLNVDSDHQHFDALDWSVVQTIEFGYGIVENLQIGLTLGWYRGDEVRQGRAHEGVAYGLHEFGDSAGMTDPWLTLKGRVYRGTGGSLSLLAGVKFPFGEDGVRAAESTETLEPALQPGSGTVDGQAGAGYSVFLTKRLTLDAGASATIRSGKDDYRIGNKYEGGFAIAYAFANTTAVPLPSIFLEAVWRHLDEVSEEGEDVVNSGGDVLYLAPGFRVRGTEHFSFTVSAAIPIVKNLNDQQQETEWKGSIGLTFTP